MRGEVLFNGAIVTIDIGHDMSCGEACRLDEIIEELGKFAVEGAQIRTTSEGETWYIYVGPPTEAARLKTEQACCELGGVLAGIGNNPDINLVTIRRELQRLAGQLGQAGMALFRENTNEERIAWARECITAGRYGPDPEEENIIDLITDLLHLARHEGHDSLAILRMAQDMRLSLPYPQR